MLTTCLEIDAFTQETLGSYIQLFHQLAAKRILLNVAEFYARGEVRIKKLDWIREVVRALHKEGFEVGIWTTTLGWGNLRSDDFEEQYKDSLRIPSFSGGGSHAICVLDRPYQQEVRGNIADFAGTGTDMILLDDDLILSARGSLGCVCKAHLERLSDRYGHAVTVADLRGAYSGAPNELRSLFLKSQGETILEYVRMIRAAADSVNPAVRIGLAASYTLFDLEGVDVEGMLRILSGKGNRPFLRLSGATYWARYASRLNNCQQSLGCVQEFVRSCRAFFRGTDIELLDENDCYPRDHRLVPATYVELYDRITLADGDDGRLKYIVQGPYSTPLQQGGKSYTNAHLRNLPYDDTLLQMFRGRTACGWRVHQERHLIQDAILPEEFAGDVPIMSRCTQSRAGAFLTGNSQTTSYGENTDGPVVAFWENARHLREAELNSGVLLDVTGAKILTDLGIDVGLRGLTQIAKPTSETFHDTGITASGIHEQNVVCQRMELATDAEVLSTFHSADGDYPACYYYENAHGQRFAVYAFDSNSLDYGSLRDWGMCVAFTPGRRAQLNALYARLSGKESAIMALQDINPGFYMLARKSSTGSLSVMFCNIFHDAVEETQFKLSAPCKLRSCIHGEASMDGDILTLKFLPAFDWFAIELET